jgi:hypothetical protein
MSDEATVPVKAKRGRPKKVRHDADPAPVDGNLSCDRIDNKEPGFVYSLVSDDDMPEMLGRGYVRCVRGNEQATPFFDIRQGTGEAHFNVKGLTMMKIKQERYDRIQGQALAIARQRTAALRGGAAQQIGGGQYASVSEHEYARSIQ